MEMKRNYFAMRKAKDNVILLIKLGITIKRIKNGWYWINYVNPKWFIIICII